MLELSPKDLDTLRATGKLSQPVLLPNGGRLRIELNHQEKINFPPGLSDYKCDNRIIAVAHNLKQETAGPVILVSKDLNLRIKADVLGIEAEDFYNDKVDYQALFKGFTEAYLTSLELDTFYREKALPWNQDPLPCPHEFLILRNSANPSQSALCRYRNHTLWPLAYEESMNWGVKARNKEQKFALELLLDDTVPVVTLVGTAGTGKTLLALAVGLEKVIEENAYSKLLVTRPVIPMGNDLGYLPGTKEEKLRPWMQPIYDNLEFLFRNCPEPFDVLGDFMHRGLLELETLTYIRGRSIPNQFIICDEAQNLSPNMIKALITRVGDGTKIVFTGDPEQIDHPYLDASSNGLTYLVERLKGEDIAGHITLVKGERSKVAELGAQLL